MYLLDRPEDIPPRLTNRLNLRIAILGAVVVAAIATVAAAALVASGPLGRALPSPRQGPRHPRRPRPSAARRDPRSQRQRPGRQPHRDEPRAAAVGSTERSERSAGGELAKLGDLLGLSQREIRQKVRGDAAVRRLPGRPPPGPRPPAALLPAREQGELPRGQRRADLRPQVSGRLARRPHTRDGRAGQPPPAEAAALPGLAARRHHRPGRCRVLIRPVPARQRRQPADPGGRARTPARAARQQTCTRPGTTCA